MFSQAFQHLLHRLDRIGSHDSIVAVTCVKAED